jgi:hypothetical protein
VLECGGGLGWARGTAAAKKGWGGLGVRVTMERIPLYTEPLKSELGWASRRKGRLGRWPMGPCEHGVERCHGTARDRGGSGTEQRKPA